MADVSESLTVLDATESRTASDQVLEPFYAKGTFVVNDTDTHQFEFASRGKSIYSCHVLNDGDEILTVTIYGLQESGKVQTDEEAVSIGSFTVAVGANTSGYETWTDPFPYYLVTVVSAGAQTGSPTAKVFYW